MDTTKIQIETGKNKSDVRREFGLVNYTIQTIWENRSEVNTAFGQNGSVINRL